MDKVISARVDEAVAARIAGLARQLHTSKKSVIEQAITMLAAKVEAGDGADVFGQTSGVWTRKESASRTVAHARDTFRKSMTRRRR